MSVSPDAKRIILEWLDNGTLDPHDELSDTEKHELRQFCMKGELDERLDAANDRYRHAVNDLLDVTLEKIAAVVRSYYPTAAALQIEADWNEDMFISVRAVGVEDENTALLDYEDAPSEGWEQFVDDIWSHLDAMIGMTGDDYVGTHTILLDRGETFDASSIEADPMAAQRNGL